MYSKKHPVLQRLLAGALTVTMVTSGVPAAAYAEAATEVAPAQDVQATAFETQATAPTTVQIQKGYSEVTTSERPSVDDELKAVPGTMEEDYWGDEGFSALSDTSGCSYQWYRGSSALNSSTSSHDDYEEIEGATGATYTVTEGDSGSYLAVKVTYDGTELWSSTSTGQVKVKGAVDLGSVELSGTPSVGETLAAKAWAGSSWSKKEVPEGTTVTYTWRYADSQYSSSWMNIEGVTGDQLSLTDEFQGKYISVVADAGGKTAELSSYYVVGPVLAKGAVKLAGVEIANDPDNTAVNGAFTVGATLKARPYTGSSSDM